VRVGAASLAAALLASACGADRPRADAAVKGPAALAEESASPSAAPYEDASAEEREFWREVARERGSVPDGHTAAEWARELDPWLASTDPELRDDIAYTVLAGWIVRGKIGDEDLRALSAKWRADLARSGAGDADVVARSFAALTLAAAVAWDAKHPFLGDETVLLRAAALDYAAREHDVRGYDAELGWIHATAHTADLLRFLARAPDLARAEQALFLAVVEAKAALPNAAWTAGEDLRLARVAVSIVARDDFDRDAFEAWISAYEAAYRELWVAPPLDALRLAAVGNRRRVLAELSALLAVESAPEPVAWARERVLRALRDTG
jgi:hypothetical protein